MSKAKKHPPFYKSLMTKETFVEATQKIKYLETRNSHVFKTGETFYKIKKESHDYSSLAVKEAFYHEEIKLGQFYAKDIYQGTIPVYKNEDVFHFKHEGTLVDYALKEKQLNERYFLNQLIQNQKLSSAMIGKIGKHLAVSHGQAVCDEKHTDHGRTENFYALCEDVLYQAGKYINMTVTQPMIDLIRRPLEKFVQDHAKLFHRRMKKQKIVHCHGSLSPEHIYVKGQETYFVSPLELHRKYADLDAANDLAQLTVELAHHGQEAWIPALVSKYVNTSRDRDILQMLPAYLTFIGMKLGMFYSEWMVGSQGEEKSALSQASINYFNLAVQFSRDIPKPD